MFRLAALALNEKSERDLIFSLRVLPLAVGGKSLKLIYKICSKTEWGHAKCKGVFEGSAVDLADGFIHFSTAEQVRETARKHFSGQDDLVLIAVNGASLGPELKWETSRGGQLFPHLYADLRLSSALSVRPLPLDEKGDHIFPDLETN